MAAHTFAAAIRPRDTVPQPGKSVVFRILTTTLRDVQFLAARLRVLGTVSPFPTPLGGCEIEVGVSDTVWTWHVSHTV